MSSVPMVRCRLSWTRKLNPKLSHLGEIGPPASGREDAIVEGDVGVDCPRKNQSGHDQIGAHESHSYAVNAQAVGELLRQHDQGCALAAPRKVPTSAYHRQLRVAC